MSSFRRTLPKRQGPLQVSASSGASTTAAWKPLNHASTTTVGRSGSATRSTSSSKRGAALPASQQRIGVSERKVPAHATPVAPVSRSTSTIQQSPNRTEVMEPVMPKDCVVESKPTGTATQDANAITPTETQATPVLQKALSGPSLLRERVQENQRMVDQGTVAVTPALKPTDRFTLSPAEPEVRHGSAVPAHDRAAALGGTQLEKRGTGEHAATFPARGHYACHRCATPVCSASSKVRVPGYAAFSAYFQASVTTEVSTKGCADVYLKCIRCLGFIGVVTADAMSSIDEGSQYFRANSLCISYVPKDVPKEYRDTEGAPWLGDDGAEEFGLDSSFDC